ncbi:DEAD/DEAH box helicase family protein [Paracoccus sp. DMF-8]|uniref:DEAD/DEAH box helicase family protein n=1 Tax=Paracoccus sp. DMF-8 TaxID=3019445 RepID=UPI0023E86DC3|nr:DEAD/DEAH box helicase family protein [Paracoccus sp. DMF-8]MDF3605758.1 DEAD/DEAH box helicase family protein [Paracoccus sp. DMF-8]
MLAARGRDGRGGVMWHTQGSGKSLLMAFLGGRLVRDPRLANPTLVVITDRNDLDNQLFATFSRCAALFGEKPEQAEDIDDLKRLLDRKVGGVIFATIQKFRPKKGETDFGLLTDRDNVIVFADEAAPIPIWLRGETGHGDRRNPLWFRPLPTPGAAEFRACWIHRHAGIVGQG